MFPIVVTHNPILEVVLCLIPQFTGDSTMQEGEVKGGKQYRQFM